jgi:hypothetical protein
MTMPVQDVVVIAQDIVGDLRRLIEAIDVRTPRPERPDEARIAADAAELRARAVAVLQRIELAAAHLTP